MENTTQDRDGLERNFIIIDASLKDDLCNYSYQVTNGVGLGDSHKVNGSGIIEDTLRHAFGKLNVHLACIDDVFKHSGIEIEDIDDLHGDELSFLYSVSGFKIKGGREDESVILIGSKYVSAAGGRIELSSPKIPLDNLSSYKYSEELKAAIDAARHQVELYKEGNYTAVEEEEVDTPKKSKARQLKISDMMGSDGDDSNDDDFIPETAIDADFEAAKA